MDIAMFADAYFPTLDGTVTFLDGLTRDLKARGHRPVLVVPSGRFRRNRQMEHDVIEVSSLHAPFAPPSYRMTWESARSVAARLSDLKFDLVHIHSPFAAAHHGFRFAARRRLPTVMTYHTLFPAYAALYGPRWGRRLWERAVTDRSRRVGNRCDLVIANSAPMVPVLRSYGITAPIHMIPVGINHNVFSQARRTRTVHERFGLPHDSPILLYVGRIGAEKSVHLLVPMLQDVRRAHDAHLVLCGQGRHVQLVEQMAAERGLGKSVHFAGVIRDPIELARYYGDADVFVFPSRTDTFGAVVVEAQAAGVPVVAVGVLGSTATVEDEVSGLLASHDAKDLSRQVCRILSTPDLASRLRATGRRRARDYSAESVTAQYLQAYAGLLKDGQDAASRR